MSADWVFGRLPEDQHRCPEGQVVACTIPEARQRRPGEPKRWFRSQACWSCFLAVTMLALDRPNERVAVSRNGKKVGVRSAAAVALLRLRKWEERGFRLPPEAERTVLTLIPYAWSTLDSDDWSSPV